MAQRTLQRLHSHLTRAKPPRENEAGALGLELGNHQPQHETSGSLGPTDEGREASEISEAPETTGGTRKGFRFWAIVAALGMSKLKLALEIIIVTTSLPTIVQKLDIGADYVWVTNGAALASTAVAPL
ncbi:hypothetical protein DL766_004723 [Monosporascus sp. MC13-8B]|nr:hypothetical protein DL766_004723 [Monosporascus sp. MC13-8B]